MALRYPKDMGTEWMNLKRQVKDAFTSANSRVPYAKIGAGIVQIFTSLQIQAGAFFRFTFSNNQLGMFLGRHFIGDDPADGLFIRRNDGTLSFWSYTRVDDGFGYTAIYDRQGNIVLSDDGNIQAGLSRPWIPYTFANMNELSNPPAVRQTSGTTDTDVVVAHSNAQHGRARAVGYVYIGTAGATAEVKFWSYPDNVLLDSITMADGWISRDFNLTGWDYASSYYVKISVRRASGTGNVGYTLVSLMGAQSPAT